MDFQSLPLARGRWTAALGVALLVFALAAFQRYETARHEATGESSICSVNKYVDCDRVQASPYAHLFDVSLSTWAAAGSLALAACIALIPQAGGAMLLFSASLAVVAALVSLAMAAISLWLVHALCLFCMGIQICSVLSAFLLIPPALRVLARPPPLRPIGAGLAFLVLFFCAAPVADAYASRGAALHRLEIAKLHPARRIEIADALTLGDPNAPHTVVVFFDFGCPFCRRCYNKALDILDRYPGKVRYVFKHWPLDKECNPSIPSTVHVGSCRAARAGQAAALHGKGPRAMKELFTDQNFSPVYLDRLGKSLGFDAKAWNEAMNSPEVERLIQRDIADGNALHFHAVPDVFLDGHAVDPDRIEEAVARVVGR